MDQSPVRHSKRPYSKDRESGSFHDRRSRRDEHVKGMTIATDPLNFANSSQDTSSYRKRRRSPSPSTRNNADKFTHVGRIDSRSLREFDEPAKYKSPSKEPSHKQRRRKPYDRDSDSLYHRFNTKPDPSQNHTQLLEGTDHTENSSSNDVKDDSRAFRHSRHSRSPKPKSRSRSPQSQRRYERFNNVPTSPSHGRRTSREGKYNPRTLKEYPLYDDQNPFSPPSLEPPKEDVPVPSSATPSATPQRADDALTNPQSQTLPDDRGKIKISLSGRRNPKEIPRGPSAYEKGRGRGRGREESNRFGSRDNRHNKSTRDDRDNDFSDHREPRDREPRDRESRERDSKERELPEPRERGSKDREFKDREFKERDSREKGSRNRDSRDREFRDREIKDREARARDFKERESRAPREPREQRESRGSREPKQRKGRKTPKEPKEMHRSHGMHESRDHRDDYSRSDSNQLQTFSDERPEEIKRPASPPGVRIQYGVVEYASNSVYNRISQIGEGTYGKVYKAINTQNNRMSALKRLRMESERDGFPITAMREIKLLQSLRHPNIVSLVEMMVEKGQVYMVFEYLDHDLAGILSHPQLSFTQGNIKYLFKQMVEGLAYLHHRGILHRDIKGSNILLSNTGLVKIADFGLARSVDLLNPDALYTNRVITLWYRPPELLLGATKYNGAVDMWGLGCILAEFFIRKALFPGHDEIGQIRSIYSLMGTPLENGWPEANELPWYQLIPPREPRKSQFISKYGDRIPKQAVVLILKLLTLNPVSRYTAEEALRDDYFIQEPMPQRPAQLESLTEEWHDFEAKQRRRRGKEVTGRPRQEGQIEGLKQEVKQDVKAEAKQE